MYGFCRYAVAPRRVILPLHRQRRSMVPYSTDGGKRKQLCFLANRNRTSWLQSTARGRSPSCQSRTVRATAILSEQGLESSMAQSQEQGVGSTRGASGRSSTCARLRSSASHGKWPRYCIEPEPLHRGDIGTVMPSC